MNLTTDSDVDRALMGLPTKRVEAQLRAANRPKWQTEFDDELEPLKRMLFRRFFTGGAIFLVVEFVLIFFVFDPTNVRVQSLNGAMVFVAAAAGFFISLLWMLMPTKRIGYESLKIVRETRELANEGAASARQSNDEIKATMAVVRESASSIKESASAIQTNLKTGLADMGDKLEAIKEAVEPEPLKNVGEDLIDVQAELAQLEEIKNGAPVVVAPRKPRHTNGTPVPAATTGSNGHQQEAP